MKIRKNRTFFWLTFILVICIFCAFKGSNNPCIFKSTFWIKIFSKYYFWDDGIYDIAISYISAYLFYIIQIYIPERKEQKQSKTVLKNKCVLFYTLMQRTSFIVSVLVKEIQYKGTIYVEVNSDKKNIYYTMKSQEDIYKQLFKFTYKQSGTKLVETIEKYYYDIINSPYYLKCNSSFINSIATLDFQTYINMLNNLFSEKLVRKEDYDDILKNIAQNLSEISDEYNIQLDISEQTGKMFKGFYESNYDNQSDEISYYYTLKHKSA